MHSRITENEALKTVFRKAYFAMEERGSGDAWRDRAMRQVRQIGPLNRRSSFWPAFEHMVWRLAPVSGILIIVLSALILNVNPDAGYDYLGSVAAELDKPVLAELFGTEG